MEFIISSTSSVLSSTLVYPIDVIKTQYQVANINQKNQQNAIQMARYINKTQGLIGFYKGLGPNLMTYPLFWGFYFEMRKVNYQPTGYLYPDKIFMSFISGVGATTLVNPFYVMKVRIQTEILHQRYKNNQSSLYHILVKNIYQKEGIIGFYKGWSTTQLNNIKLGIQLPFYDYLKEKTDSTIISSMVAKLSASTVFYPFDLVRTNQRDSINKIRVIDCLRDIYQKEGIRGLYRGVGLYNLMTGPNFIFMMYFKDLIISLMDKKW